MSLTNFPGGVSSFGIPVIGSGPIFTTGNVFFVSSTATNPADNTAHGTKEKPFATLDYAVGQCTADNGDYIILMPKHAESITSTSGLALDAAGITIIGLGAGGQRPRLVVETAITVTANDVVLKNAVFAAGAADVARCFQLTTATGFNVIDLEFVQDATNENFSVIVDSTGISNTADGLTVAGCVWTSVDAVGEQMVRIAGALDRLVFRDNFISTAADGSEAIIECATGKALTDCFIVWNFTHRENTAGDLFINNDVDINSGIVAHNRIGHADTASEVLIDLDGVRFFDNLGTATDTASGFILPAIDS